MGKYDRELGNLAGGIIGGMIAGDGDSSASRSAGKSADRVIRGVARGGDVGDILAGEAPRAARNVVRGAQRDAEREQRAIEAQQRRQDRADRLEERRSDRAPQQEQFVQQETAAPLQSQAPVEAPIEAPRELSETVQRESFQAEVPEGTVSPTAISPIYTQVAYDPPVSYAQLTIPARPRDVPSTEPGVPANLAATFDVRVTGIPDVGSSADWEMDNGGAIQRGGSISKMVYDTYGRENFYNPDSGEAANGRLNIHEVNDFVAKQSGIPNKDLVTPGQYVHLPNDLSTLDRLMKDDAAPAAQPAPTLTDQNPRVGASVTYIV